MNSPPPLRIRLLCILCALGAILPTVTAAPKEPELAWPGYAQHAAFPVPAAEYGETGGGLGATLLARAKRDPFNVVATAIFLCAILHTFGAGQFNRWAHAAEVEHRARLKAEGKHEPPHPDGLVEVSFRATALHFLGEVEAVFGLWAIALAVAATAFYSWNDFTAYMQHDRHFGEPVFVVVIMCIAASRPVLRFAETVVRLGANLGKGSRGAWWLAIMTVPPLLGSLITEPAAMTIGALLLAKQFYKYQPGPAFASASLGLLFVNVSVGGVLTHFAAPPVLMVAGTWGWDTVFMLTHFGYKAVLGMACSSLLYFAVFRGEFALMKKAEAGSDEETEEPGAWPDRDDHVPSWVTLTHLGFLAWTVANVHQPVLFIGGFLFFLAFVMATGHHQNAILLRGPMLVGFFLAGLIVHGGCQGWWIEPVIKNLPSNWLMLGATVLTAFNDNAAITYLAAQVQGIPEASKLAVVAGAITGGGLTVIANAPNPAGQSILGRYFRGRINPLGLFLGALAPTVVCYLAFSLLPSVETAPHQPTAPAVQAGPAAPGQ